MVWRMSDTSLQGVEFDFLEGQAWQEEVQVAVEEIRKEHAIRTDQYA